MRAETVNTIEVFYGASTLRLARGWQGFQVLGFGAHARMFRGFGLTAKGSTTTLEQANHSHANQKRCRSCSCMSMVIVQHLSPEAHKKMVRRQDAPRTQGFPRPGPSVQTRRGRAGGPQTTAPGEVELFTTDRNSKENEPTKARDPICPPAGFVLFCQPLPLSRRKCLVGVAVLKEERPPALLPILNELALVALTALAISKGLNDCTASTL